MKHALTTCCGLTLLLAACAGNPAPSPAPRPQSGSLPAGPTAPLTPASHPANGMTAIASISRTIAEPVERVGLVSDQASVVFPRVDGGYYIVTDAGPSVLRRGFTVTAPLQQSATRYAVQAGAISDQTSATTFAQKIRTDTGLRVDSVFDPGTSNGGLYKILVGDFADTKSAQPLRDRLVTGGYGKDLLIVRRPSDQVFVKRTELVDDEGDRTTIDGQSLLVLPVSGDTLLIDQKPYRTSARLYINPRGLLNVINELNLEDYLRGVVPAEMGSHIYDELEALKAQAIAARTYAVRNHGQFASEGFDICPGPACQAYKGFSGEEPMTDQAVRETAGQILTYEGKPIDALYTATCGGQTSDVATMFPGRNEPYLKAASCVELAMTSVEGRSDSAVLTETQMNARVFGAVAGLPEESASWSGSDVERAVRAAIRLIGFAPDPMAAVASTAAIRPASSRRGDVLTYLARTLSLDAYARVLTLPEDRTYFFPQSGDAERTPYLAAAFLVKFGFLPAEAIDRLDLNAAMPREELYGILGSWLRKHEALKEVTGKIVSVSGRSLVLKAEGKNATFTLPAGIPIFRRIGDRYQEYRSAPVMAGDRAFLQQSGRKTPVALVIQANYDGASFDRTSSFADWTRSYRADELVTSINKRNPITELRGIRPMVTDASKRIAEMEVTAEGGRTFVLKGLPVRWSLNVPDNLFVFEKSKDSDGVDRYTFYGKGWGHGVGFCQVGAYGMAFRGATAEQILKHYYTGVEIVPMGTPGK